MQLHPYAAVTALAMQAAVVGHRGPAYYAAIALEAAAIIAAVYYAIRFARNRWQSSKPRNTGTHLSEMESSA
jgi:hypothetical protein